MKVLDNIAKRFGYQRAISHDREMMEELGLVTKPESASGVRINRSTVYQSGAVFRGVNLIASALAKTPIVTYRLQGDGDKQAAKKHPAYQLLKIAPNPETTPFHFKQTLTAHALLHGGGYAYIVRDEHAVPIELIPLPADRTYPIREAGRLMIVTFIGGGDQWESSGEPVKLLYENVLHIRGLGWDTLTGYSVMELMAQTAGASIARELFGARFFANSATPGVVIKVPTRMTDGAYKRLKDSWTKVKAGLSSAHKAAILEEGAELQDVAHSAKDSQLIEASQHDLVMLSNFIGVPPHKLGAKGYNSHNSLESENQSLLDEAYDPWMCGWECECEKKLLTSKQQRGETVQIRYKRQALVRVDMMKRYASYRTGLGGHPFLQPAEVRKLEDLPTIEGLNFVPSPLNMESPLNDEPAPDPEPPADPPPAEGDDQAQRDAFGMLLETSLQRICRRVDADCSRLESKQESYDAESLLERHRSVIESQLGPVAVMGDAIGVAIPDDVSERIASEAAGRRSNDFADEYPKRYTRELMGVAGDG